MADAPVTVSKLDGLFKEVYGDDIPNLVPGDLHVQKKVPFVKKDKQEGKSYNQPVRLTDSHGVTYATADSGAFTLADANALTLKNASVNGAQLVIREQMSYDIAYRSAQSKAAFQQGAGYVMEGMQQSFRKRLELELLYGQDELGTIASVSTNDLTIDTAEWAPGIWAGAEGAQVEIFDAAGTTLRGSTTISSVDLDNRVVTVASAPGGTTSTDRIFFIEQHDTTGSNQMAGIHKILTNSGSLFGISAATYSLWAGTQYAAGSAALTQNKLGKALAQAVSRGLSGKVELLVNPSTWQDLMDDQAALRRYTEKESKGKGSVFMNGAEELIFHHLNGVVAIHSHNMVKEGYAYGLRDGDWLRPGSADFSVRMPGIEEKLFHQLASSAGVEVRGYSSQAIFCECPAKSFVITGIVNS